MSRLGLYFLGTPRLERDGTAVKVDTRKATALAAYLAVTRREHSRDALAALLWPEYDQQHARGALRRTLSVLRNVLGAEAFAVTPDTIGLAWAADLRVDVDRFLQVVAGCRPSREPGQAGEPPAAALPPGCRERLVEAAELYRGDFLAGFSLRDSAEFDEWQFIQSESLRRDLGLVLERLVQVCAGQGDLETALAYARRWLSLDPLHEPVHRRLMQLYAFAGQRSAAMRQYQECVRILAQELGVAPLEETTRLYEQIRERKGIYGQASLPVTAHVSLPNVAPAAPAQAQPATGGAATRVAKQGLAGHGSGLWPLAGRAADWARLQDAYAAAARTGQCVVLAGEAGIGKTRLAEELLAQARSAGAPVVAAPCYQGEASLAYAPFVTALRAAAGSLAMPNVLAGLPPAALAEVARLLPELRSAPAGAAGAPLDGPGAQVRFFEGVMQVLLAACAPAAGQRSGAPGVLFFDDVQWMDAASLDLLAYLVRRLPGHALCLLIAWRDDEVPSGHALRRLLAETQRAGYGTCLHLARLSLQALAELLASLGPRFPAAGVTAEGADAALAALVEQLYRETEGLPFFMVEYLSALASGALAAAGGAWPMPGGVYNLLAARLTGISGAGRQLLGAAAVLGRSFDFETLREVSGRTDEEAVAGLEELLAHGLVRQMPASVDGAAYDFAHQKLCEVAYADTSAARRRLLHRRVAECLARRLPASAKYLSEKDPWTGSGAVLRIGAKGADSSGVGDTLRSHAPQPGGGLAGLIAQHYQAAGQEEAAALYYALAGAYARSLYANVAALRHYRAALALGHPDQAGLHEAIGDLQTLLGDYGGALASYHTSLALLRAALPSAAAGPGAGGTGAVLEHKLGMLHLRRGEWELASGHLQDALDALGDQGPLGLRSHLYADASLAAHRLGLAEQAQELAQRAHRLAAEAADSHALAQAENALGMLARARGDAQGACTHLEAALALAEALGDPALRAAARNNLALACAETGATARAIALVESALDLVRILGDRHREAALHNNLADLLHARGDTEGAMAHLKLAVTIFAGIRTEADTMQPEIWKLSEW